jgi:hypothetical protein
MEKLTPQAQAWLKADRDRKLIQWTVPGQKKSYVFEGDFYHKGVDLTAAEVLNIQADHVYGDALQWSQEWNGNPENPYVRFAGIKYIGPVEGKWWEDKGKKSDGRRYHKFGGVGQAYILTFS